MIFNITHSITIMTDGCTNFRKFLIEGTKPNLKKINEYVERSDILFRPMSGLPLFWLFSREDVQRQAGLKAVWGLLGGAN